MAEKRPFNKLLIANRGEIAVRIIHTCRELGIATVAVYSEADAEALHVCLADEAVAIGPPPASESYLRGERIIAAARERGAEAIHPGYGFLAENADFAQAVHDAGLTFIGPPPEAIRAMGSKAEAREIMLRAGVPVVPGYQGEDQSEARLTVEAERIGFPLLVKAAAGGGGKGMRLASNAAELLEQRPAAPREAAPPSAHPPTRPNRSITQARAPLSPTLPHAHTRGPPPHYPPARHRSAWTRHRTFLTPAPCAISPA